jgi:hypothetical protein
MLAMSGAITGSLIDESGHRPVNEKATSWNTKCGKLDIIAASSVDGTTLWELFALH